jgi:aryl-alcohol dehydrogenase-like predicted oxidoreductase
LKVSVVGLGTNNFGGACDEAQSARVVHKCLDEGINTIDTADSYGQGVSEQFIGKALAGRRHDAIVMTKVFSKMGPGPNDEGSSRSHIMDGCDASLKRLATDFIDVYQVHRFDPNTPLEETMRALDDLVKAGKVRYIGCSNFAAWQLAHANWVADKHNLTPFVAVQPHYNMFVRDVEKELLPACAALGVGVIPFFPLASGLLTGKYKFGEAPPAGTRLARNPRGAQQLDEVRMGKVEKLREVAAEANCSVAQLAIAWLLHHNVVSTVIAGATKEEQVVENAKAADVELHNSTVEKIEAILAG